MSRTEAVAVEAQFKEFLRENPKYLAALATLFLLMNEAGVVAGGGSASTMGP